MNVIIYSESKDHAQGIARYMRPKTDGQISTVAVNEVELSDYHQNGVDMVYTVNSEAVKDYNITQYTAIMKKAIEESEAKVIIFSATKRGTELASSIAATLKTGCITGCYDITPTDGRLQVKKYVYGGSVVSQQTSQEDPHILTLTQTTQEGEVTPGAGEQAELVVDIPDSRVTIKEKNSKKKVASNLKEAKIIVSAGRGFKKQEDMNLLEALATAIDASVGCTRPMAADHHWFEEWIGISGEKVAPELYVACGISGTIQHLSGIRDSKIILSINNDPSASIHNVSDYSIIADLYTILPVLTEKLG